MAGTDHLSNVENHPSARDLRGVPGVLPDIVRDRGGGTGSTCILTCWNGSLKQGWDGVLRVSQPSPTPDTGRHVNDTRRWDGTPNFAVPARVVACHGVGRLERGRRREAETPPGASRQR